jgi:hypothetical protein
MLSGSGTFLLTGFPAGAIELTVLTANAGAFVLSGQAVLFQTQMTSGKGTFLLSGGSVATPGEDERPHSIPFLVTVGPLTAR